MNAQAATTLDREEHRRIAVNHVPVVRTMGTGPTPRHLGAADTATVEATSMARPKPLTDRQRQALRVYAEEHHYKGVASRLGISTQAVKNHMTDAFRRLGVDGHLGAFIALGWLVLPEE